VGKTVPRHLKALQGPRRYWTAGYGAGPHCSAEARFMRHTKQTWRKACPTGPAIMEKQRAARGGREGERTIPCSITGTFLDAIPLGFECEADVVVVSFLHSFQVGHPT